MPAERGRTDVRTTPLAHRVEDVVAAVMDGVELTDRQLEDLQSATGRLRRALESRAISRSALCLWCAEPYARQVTMSAYCSVTCQQEAERERANDLVEWTNGTSRD